MKPFLLFIAISVSAQAGIIEPLVKWKKSTVSVCFANSLDDFKNKVQNDRIQGLKFYPFTDQEKDLIIRTIESSYSESLTGISFAGWKDCDDDREADAIIARTKKIYFLGLEVAGPTFKGESSIGQDGDSEHQYETLSGKMPLVTLNDGFTSTTIAHEFGHLAGLRHEHIHPDASSDVECLKYFNLSKRSYNSYFAKSSDHFYPSTKAVTVYDRNSIMNYCAIETRGNVREELLTDLDRQTLKEEYASVINRE